MDVQIQSSETNEIDEVPQTLLRKFRERRNTVRFSKNQTIIEERDESSDVYLILKGRVQFLLMTTQGRDVIFRDMFEGELFGEGSAIAQTLRSVSVIAVTDCELLRLSKRDFLAACNEDNAVFLWLARRLAARVVDLTGKVLELATLPVAARVQLQLLRFADEVGNHNDRCLIKDMPTHTRFASRIGTQREAVTRELNLLAKEGLVRKTGQHLEIVSVRNLRSSFNRLSK